MYEDLINKLRYCGNAVSCLHCPYWEGCAGSKEDLTEAADAIEELSKRVPPVPHGRLIDADAFTKDECNSCDGACESLPCDCLNCEADCRCDFMKDIADAPTIIPAEEGE